MTQRRNDFPILKTTLHGHPLIYLDNAATTQKPQPVIDAMANFYAQSNSPVHRSIHDLAEQATLLYENARQTVARFINADPDEVIFTSGTTESINYIAQTWAKDALEVNDEILLTQMEHHANMVPWQMLAQEKKARIQYLPVLPTGVLDIRMLDSLLRPSTKLVSLTHISNVLGTINDIETITVAAHKKGAKVFIDVAQSIPHRRIDVRTLKCDFLAFSGHKMGGPTGIGVLYVKKELQETMRPYRYGGGMVREVSFDHVQLARAPHKFEAGTPPIAQAIGLAAAIEYAVSHQREHAIEPMLCRMAIEELSRYSRIRLLGPLDQLKEQGHLLSFVIDGIHAHDVAHYLSHHGICVRAGNQCAQPLHRLLGIEASVRASFYYYNTVQEIEEFLRVIKLMLKK